MAKQNTLLRRTHEKDLSNVVLAYDTRMDTLENKIRVHTRNNTKLNMMLEQLKHVYHSQCMEIKTFQAKIKLFRARWHHDAYHPVGLVALDPHVRFRPFPWCIWRVV